MGTIVWDWMSISIECNIGDWMQHGAVGCRDVATSVLSSGKAARFNKFIWVSSICLLANF